MGGRDQGPCGDKPGICVRTCPASLRERALGLCGDEHGVRAGDETHRRPLEPRPRQGKGAFCRQPPLPVRSPVLRPAALPQPPLFLTVAIISKETRTPPGRGSRETGDGQGRGCEEGEGPAAWLARARAPSCACWAGGAA